MHALLHHRGSEDHVGMGHRGGYQVQVVEIEAAIADFVPMCGCAMAVPPPVGSTAGGVKVAAACAEVGGG